jgi:hypothetical protein
LEEREGGGVQFISLYLLCLFSISPTYSLLFSLFKSKTNSSTYKGYVNIIFTLWLEHLTYVIAFSIQLASRAARRDLINSLLLDILETGIYLGGI